MEIPLYLRAQAEKHRYLFKFKSSWEKRYRPTRMKEIYEGVDLANYLTALDRQEEAISLLVFITTDIQFTGNYNIWSPAGAGLILLARLFLINQKEKDYERVIQRVLEHDIRAGKKEEYYKIKHREHAEVFARLSSETQKWACHILSRHIMGLNYLYEMKRKKIIQTKMIPAEELEEMIKESYIALRQKLG